jgi:hypothetical protein
MSVLESLDFQPMLITEVFDSLNSSKAWYDKSKLDSDNKPTIPFISRTKARNGVDIFCAYQEKEPEQGNAITIGLDTQTIGYHTVPFYTSQNIQVLRHKNLNSYTAAVLCTILQGQMRKFSWGGNGATLGRLKRTRIMIPVLTAEDGDISVDWEGMNRLGEEIFSQVVTNTHTALVKLN